MRGRSYRRTCRLALGCGLALVLLSTPTMLSAGDPCALCEYGLVDGVWKHHFTPNPETGEPTEYTEGDGFHSAWQEGNGQYSCANGTHDHEYCDGGTLLALEKAVVEGDLLAVDVLVATNDRIRWNTTETAVTMTGCDGVPVTLQVGWLPAAASAETAE